MVQAIQKSEEDHIPIEEAKRLLTNTYPRHSLSRHPAEPGRSPPPPVTVSGQASPHSDAPPSSALPAQVQTILDTIPALQKKQDLLLNKCVQMNEEHIKLNADYNRLKSVTIPGLEKSIDAIRAKTSDIESAINEAKKETAKLETTFSSRFNKIDVALGLILQSMAIPPGVPQYSSNHRGYRRLPGCRR